MCWRAIAASPDRDIEVSLFFTTTGDRVPTDQMTKEGMSRLITQRIESRNW